MTKKIVLGIFPKSHDADDALFHLKDEGFKSEEMSVIAREGVLDQYQSDSQADATATGVFLGGLAGLLIVATPVFVPGLGVIVAGPLTALLGTLVGAAAGGLIGTLIDMGLSEEQARRYEKRLQEGGVLLSVPVSDADEKRVREIMRKHSAEEIAVVPFRERARNLKTHSSSAAFASEVRRPVRGRKR